MLGKSPYLKLAIVLIIFANAGCKTVPGSKNLSKQDTEKLGKADEVKKTQAAAQSMRVPIGTVHMVDQAGKFALIKSTRTASLEPETKIFTYSPDARMSSELKVSPARKGSYLTADFVEGIPAVGETVMMEHTIQKTPQTTAGQTPPSDVQVLE